MGSNLIYKLEKVIKLVTISSDWFVLVEPTITSNINKKPTSCYHIQIIKTQNHYNVLKFR